MTPSNVYYTTLRARPGDSLLNKLERLLDRAGMGKIDFTNKYVAIKIHFGEPGNLSYLRPNYAKVVADFIRARGGKPFLTDCNTLYVGGRKNALDHLESAYVNGYSPTTTGCHLLIADGLKGTDEAYVPVEGGAYVKEAKIGRAVMDADIVISLNHFKGHECTGFGGALKNLGVGCGRCIGLCPVDAIQPAEDEANDILNCKIAEYAKAVVHGRPGFHINLVMDVSPYCDCHGENDVPMVPNVGMFASFDPVAIDVACADAVNAMPVYIGSALYEAQGEGHCHEDHFGAQHPETNWKSCVEHAEKIGIGQQAYTLIEVK